MELIRSRRNEETITEKESFVFISGKEFQRSTAKIPDTVLTMVQSGLFETEEAEAFAWDIGNLEVRSRMTTLSFKSLFRRSISVHEYPSFETSMTQDLMTTSKTKIARQPHLVTRWDHASLFDVVTDPSVLLVIGIENRVCNQMCRVLQVIRIVFAVKPLVGISTIPSSC